jgi:tetratricopeptide (TPR) repeat protein/Tol biopolymer transport system component
MKKKNFVKIASFFLAAGIVAVILWQLIPFLLKDDTGSIIAEWKRSGEPGNLVIEYPRDGTLFPPEIAPPTFTWKDKTQKADAWLVVTDIDGKVEQTSTFIDKEKWKPDAKKWALLKRLSTEKKMRVTVLGFKRDDPNALLSGSSIQFSTSKDEVGALIFYRDVPLPFEFAYKHLDTIRWRLGDIASEKPSRVMLANLPLCGNCHSFTPDGETLAMDVDYANDKGSYVISKMKKETILTPEKIITWSDYRRQDGEMTFGLLSHISPNGRYVLSTVKDRSIFVPIDELYYSQLFFPIKGIIGVYDRDTKKFWSLPGANNPAYVQSNPTWSPDGKHIIFARSEAYISEKAEKSGKAVLPTSFAAEFIEGRRDFKYDLYRIPFNEGNGGTAEPIPGASNNGMSNYFPKFSPDGKWIVFCKAKNFMLLQPDSKLYIMTSKGGTPREMNCNTPNMNSWHSWSPNGRWLVFASKALNAYTQLFLTHIDENGNDTPPVLIESFILPERAINIPEFVNINMDKWQKIVDNFSEDVHYFVRIGEDKFFTDDYEGAIKEYNKALQHNPNNADIYVKRGDAKAKANDYQEAIDDYNKALALNPSLPIAYKNRGNVKFSLGEYQNAFEDYEKAIALNPEYYEAYDRRGHTRYQLKDFQGALADINKAIELNPEGFSLYSSRAFLKTNSGDFPGALEDYKKAIQLKPDFWGAYCSIGDVKRKLKNPNGAIEDYTKVIQEKPDFWRAYFGRGEAKFDLNNMNGAIEDYSKVIQLKPDYYDAYERRANIKSRLNDLQGALKDINEAIRLKPDNFQFYSNRGDLKYELKNLHGALADYNSSLQLKPNDALILYKRGMIKILLGQKDSGCLDLHKSQGLGFTNATMMIRKHCGGG